MCTSVQVVTAGGATQTSQGSGAHNTGHGVAVRYNTVWSHKSVWPVSCHGIRKNSSTGLPGTNSCRPCPNPTPMGYIHTPNSPRGHARMGRQTHVCTHMDVSTYIHTHAAQQTCIQCPESEGIQMPELFARRRIVHAFH